MNRDGSFEVAALTEGASLGRLFMLFVSGLAAAILIFTGIVEPNTELFWVAILPATILAILLFRRPVDRNGYLTSEGIVLESPSLVIPTDQIQGLLLGGLCQNPDGKLIAGAIHIFHPWGVHEVKKSVLMGSAELYERLLSLVPQAVNPPQAAVLQKFFAEQSELFGSNLVQAFNPRPYSVPPLGGSRHRLMWLSLIGVGIAWIWHGNIVGNAEQWIVFGVMLVVIFSLILLLSFAKPTSRAFGIRKINDCGVVISPSGLAVVQGNHKGILKWEELKDIRFGANMQRFRISNQVPIARSIVLKVAGADIPLVDIYDKPLATIHGLIQAFWRGKPAE